MDSPTIAFIGGTGPQGRGLAYRFAAAGHTILIGSREPGRAAETAHELRRRLPHASVEGVHNDEAAKGGDIVVVAVPYSGHASTLAPLAHHLAGKIVISCVNPLGFDRRGPFALTVPMGSAAEELQALAADAHVVGAFHHLSADNLWNHRDLTHEDVLVCGDDGTAKAVVIGMTSAMTGRQALDAGPLRIARQLEPFTAVLISLNKRYAARSGVGIVGLDRE